MKKKFLCLLLCLCLLIPAAFSGCSNNTSDVDVNSTVNTTRTAVTLSFWIITDETTTDAAKSAMQKAFNAVTEANYTTHVEFVFCTEAEYKAKLDGKFAVIDGKPAGTNSKPSSTNTTYVDDDGMTVLKYPDVGTYQVDIVLLTGKDMLNEYVKAGRLSSLNDGINNTYKNIKKYVYNDILDNAKINGTWYAVPNNSMIGEYTFMMVNKEMADKYYFKAEDFTSFGTGTPAAQLIDLIAKNEDTSVISPMYQMADYPLAKYWSKNGGPSILTTLYATAGTLIGNGVSASNLFADASYKSYMNEMFYCKENGYMATAQDKFGVGVMKGDYSAFAEYGDEYYITVLNYPRLEDDAIFDAMLGVTSYTANLTRSMEIVTALNCDSELRNILQYGVEGVHYELEDGAVHRLNHDYMMNINYTGNVMMAYPEEGMSKDIWKTAILQNQQSLLSVVCGSYDYVAGVDATAWQEMSDISDAYFDRLYACETQAEFNAYLDAAVSEIKAADYFVKLTTALDKDGQFVTTSLDGAVKSWWTAVYGSQT